LSGDSRADRDLVPDVVIDWSSNQRSGDSATSERLQKVLAAAGVASRRVCENLIVAGRVTVNGEIVTELGSRVEPATDLVAVDGVAIQLDASKRYIMLNKPTGVVSSMADENGRRDLREFTADYDERLFNVGRLDGETSGLLLLTNDGALANVLAHPRYGVHKTYIAKVTGSVNAPTLRRLKEGIELDDGLIAADAARLLEAHQPPPLLSSFRPEALMGARQGAPNLPRALLLDTLWPGWEDMARMLGVVAVVTNHRLMDAALCAQIHASGWRALCYTVNDPADVERLLALPVDGLISDEIERFASRARAVG